MQASPRRLRRPADLTVSPEATARRPASPAARWPRIEMYGQHRPNMRRRLRAVRRLVLVLAWTLLAALVQAVCLVVPGRAKVVFARIYWNIASRLFGVRVQVLGQVLPAGARPVVFVSNHSSWLDIPVLGGLLKGCFVSKDDVAGWPGLGLIAKLGRTVFVSRQRGSTSRERDAMIERMAAGDNLILFPEGTSSDGSRVLPFRSSFFAICDGAAKPLIQPVSIVYDRLAGLPTGRIWRPVFAWYGDMDIASHVWRLAQFRGLRATVVLHEPLDPAAFANRKALSQAVWTVIADSAAALRQNRPARPLVTVGAASVPDAPLARAGSPAT